MSYPTKVLATIESSDISDRLHSATTTTSAPEELHGNAIGFQVSDAFHKNFDAQSQPWVRARELTLNGSTQWGSKRTNIDYNGWTGPNLTASASADIRDVISELPTIVDRWEMGVSIDIGTDVNMTGVGLASEASTVFDLEKERIRISRAIDKAVDDAKDAFVDTWRDRIVATWADFKGELTIGAHHRKGSWPSFDEWCASMLLNSTFSKSDVETALPGVSIRDRGSHSGSFGTTQRRFGGTVEVDKYYILRAGQTRPYQEALLQFEDIRALAKIEWKQTINQLILDLHTETILSILEVHPEIQMAHLRFSLGNLDTIVRRVFITANLTDGRIERPKRTSWINVRDQIEWELPTSDEDVNLSTIQTIMESKLDQWHGQLVGLQAELPRGKDANQVESSTWIMFLASVRPMFMELFNRLKSFGQDLASNTSDEAAIIQAFDSHPLHSLLQGGDLSNLTNRELEMFTFYERVESRIARFAEFSRGVVIITPKLMQPGVLKALPKAERGYDMVASSFLKGKKPQEKAIAALESVIERASEGRAVVVYPAPAALPTYLTNLINHELNVIALTPTRDEIKQYFERVSAAGINSIKVGQETVSILEAIRITETEVDAIGNATNVHGVTVRYSSMIESVDSLERVLRPFTFKED